MDGKIHVATAYWNDDYWVIAAGLDEAAVQRDAATYMRKHTAKYNAVGQFEHPDENGRCAEGFYIESVTPST